MLTLSLKHSTPLPVLSTMTANPGVPCKYHSAVGGVSLNLGLVYSSSSASMNSFSCKLGRPDCSIGTPHTHTHPFFLLFSLESGSHCNSDWP